MCMHIICFCEEIRKIFILYHSSLGLCFTCLLNHFSASTANHSAELAVQGRDELTILH